MASEHYLFCPKTNEAVETLRHSANGLNTPFSTKDLNKQVWSFLSYHFGKNTEFEFSDLQFKEDWFTETSVIELEEQLKAINGYDFGDIKLNN